MNSLEFELRFDVLYNNITSNLAPGLNTYEKCIFLTKAQNEKIKNYFSANSAGNALKEGFDDSAKRLADFSSLMYTKCEKPLRKHEDPEDANKEEVPEGFYCIDDRSTVFKFPSDMFIPINEVVTSIDNQKLLIISLKYGEYTLLMLKPYKRPLKNLAWRLINSGDADTKYVEIIAGPGIKLKDYTVRYIRVPKPIIIGSLDGLTIDGYCYTEDKKEDSEYSEVYKEAKGTEGCELDDILHEEILQRAVELAKIAWAGNQEELALTQLLMTAGTRSE